jgi:hypothetical protein
MELTAAGQESGLEAVRAVAPGVLVGVSLDQGDQEVRVTSALVDGWGVSFDDVLDAAMKNALARKYQVDRLNHGICQVNDYSFCGALWLAPQLLRQIPVRGHQLVMTPVRGTTLVGADTVPVLTAFAGLMGDILENGNSIELTQPYRQAADGWQAVPFDTDGVRRDLATRASRLVAQQLYGRQKAIVQARVGDDVSVSSFRVMKEPASGQAVSTAIWAEGLATILPRADQVQLVMSDMTRQLVLWDRMAAVIPDLLTAMPDCPLEMFRTNGFPSPEQRRAMSE